ncbi:hypothetical protein H5410_055667, partial [Solanum commersonii]
YVKCIKCYVSVYPCIQYNSSYVECIKPNVSALMYPAMWNVSNLMYPMQTLMYQKHHFKIFEQMTAFVIGDKILGIIYSSPLRTITHLQISFWKDHLRHNTTNS